MNHRQALSHLFAMRQTQTGDTAFALDFAIDRVIDAMLEKRRQDQWKADHEIKMQMANFNLSSLAYISKPEEPKP